MPTDARSLAAILREIRAAKPMLRPGWRSALEQAAEALEAAEKVIRELDRLSRSVTVDLCSAHDARREYASQSMREDDTDLRHDFHNAGRAAADWCRKYGSGDNG